MKILDITIKRKVNCSANVCKWNHWDHDHINFTHKDIYEKSVDSTQPGAKPSCCLS